MSTSSPFAGLIGAVVAATSYSGPVHAQEASVSAQAVADIRHARVELYCGHDAEGIADIRSACRELQGLAGSAREPALQALQEATFHARRHRVTEAEAALDTALRTLV